MVVLGFAVAEDLSFQWRAAAMARLFCPRVKQQLVIVGNVEWIQVPAHRQEEVRHRAVPLVDEQSNRYGGPQHIKTGSDITTFCSLQAIQRQLLNFSQEGQRRFGSFQIRSFEPRGDRAN